MKLTRITLVNWFLLEPVQIELRDNVAFLGDNGAGKSSIIDAIQTILFGGNKRHINLNASSSEKRSNERDIKSYCLGTFEPQDSNDSTHTSRLRDECITYAALTFTKDDKSHVNLILGIEARESDRRESYPIRAILSGDKAVELSDFIHTKQENEQEVMNPEMVIQRFNISKSSENNNFDIVTFAKSGEYLEQLAHSLSPENTHQKIDPDYLVRVLSKSISLKELNDISNFVDNFILEPSDINIQRLKSQQKDYENITIEIQKAVKKLEDLSYISKCIKRSILKIREGLSLSWLILEQKLEAEYECKDEHYDLRRKAVLTLRDLHRTLKRDEARVVFLEKELLELDRQINEDEPQKRKRELNDKINKLKSEKTDLEGKKRDLFAMLNDIKASDYDVLKLENISTLVMKISESLRENNHNEVDALIQAYFEKIEQIKQDVQSKQGDVHAKFKTLKDQITRLVNNIRAAEEGKPNFTPSTTRLIAYLKQHNIEAVPACSLVEISDKTWQPSVEALLSNDLEALIVDESDEVAAYSLYMELRKTPQSIYGAKVVKTSRIKSLNVSLRQGYAAQLISSDNETALKFMQYKLGRYKLVKTEEELKDNRFAITKDGMLSNDVTVTGIKLKTSYKIGKDQTKNIEYWQNEKEKLEEERLALEPSINKLEKIYNTNIKLGNYDWETQNFGSINLKVGKLEGQITELTLEESKIDLTHLTVLKDKVEEYDKEKENLKKKNTTNHREIGIQGKTNETEKKLILESLTKSKKLKSEQSQITDQKDYDPATTDKIQIKHEDRSREDLEGLLGKASSKVKELLSQAKISFRIYQERDTDSFDENVLDLFKTDLALLDKKICDEKDSIKKYNLAPHEKDAKNSEEAINMLFKNEVVSELKDKFSNLKQQFNQLNRALSDREFHSHRYKFIYKPKSELEPLIKHVIQTDISDLKTSGGLFDNTPTEVKEIVDRLMDEEYGNDYRKYFTYDVEIIDVTTNRKKKLSALLGTGSGGEKQAPFYVAISSALASAWKSMSGSGGAGLALLDEAFNKLDEENLKNAMKFMNDAGIQVLVAAPSDKDLVFKSATETIVYVSKEGETVDLDTDIRTDKGWEVLHKDNPRLNPELLQAALEGAS